MAIVLKDGERLYLTNWEYNMARVISEMARLIQDRGGRCKPLPYAMVTNRTNYNKAIELKSRIERLEQNINKYSNTELIEKLKTAIEKTRAEYEQAKMAADNEKPVKVEYTSYIDFVLNDTRYYFQIDNNPFFPVLASKTPVKNGKYSRDAVLGECNTEWALLGRKVMANLDSILKSRDITLSTKVCLVKAMVFPVVMYGCESWTVKKAECRRIDAFELWCWRRLWRVPWTARRSNQCIQREISPGCSLEGLMLKLKLQYFGHLIQRAHSFEKTLMLGKIEGGRRRG